MKIKKEAIILVFFLLIIISGCTNLPNLQNINLPSFGQKEKTITESKGLQIKFIENQPPLDELFAGQNFKISLELTNNDPEAISGTITLSDTPSDEFSNLEGKEQQSFSLAPAEIIQEGSQRISKSFPSKERITFGPYQYDENKVFPAMSTNFIVELITNHKTTISSQICIKSDSNSEIRCPNKETITPHERAKFSPVAVTRIEKTIVPEEEGLINLNLKITLKNIGKGKIDNEEETLNSFNINLQGSNSLVCSRTSKISLKEGERQIICTTELSISDEVFRQEVLDISFEFPYKIIETLGPIRVTKLEVE